MTNSIPLPVIAVVAEELASWYSHAQLNVLFYEHGAKGDPPGANKTDKCMLWLKLINKDPNLDPLAALGGLIQLTMDVEPSDDSFNGVTSMVGARRATQERIQTQLAKHGLRYELGGRILGAHSLPTAKTLRDLIRQEDLSGIQRELDRALEQVEQDPAAAVTASCAMLESVFRHIIEGDQLPLPTKQSIKPLWDVVKEHLKLDPKLVEDADLLRILGGIASVVDRIGSFRTHAGSAHGKGRLKFKVEPRHARLLVHAASTLAIFVLETWFQLAVTATRK